MKTTMTCPVCDDTFTRAHAKDKPPRTCSRACANKIPGRMTPEVRAKIGDSTRGERHPNWINGQWIANTGRIFVRVPPEERHLHPTIRKDGYIQRYHYVWNTAHPEEPVKSGDIIHHKDGDMTNDVASNLEKMTQSRHASLHFKGVPKSPEHVRKMTEAQRRRRIRERELRASADGQS